MHGKIGQKALTTKSIAALSVSDKLEIAANAFVDKENVQFTTLDKIEDLPEVERNAQPTAGTVLEPIVNALIAADVPTEATVGGVQKSLGVDFQTLHDATCNCKHDNQILGAHMRNNFWDLAENHRKN